MRRRAPTSVPGTTLQWAAHQDGQAGAAAKNVGKELELSPPREGRRIMRQAWKALAADRETSWSSMIPVRCRSGALQAGAPNFVLEIDQRGRRGRDVR